MLNILSLFKLQLGGAFYNGGFITGSAWRVFGMVDHFLLLLRLPFIHANFEMSVNKVKSDSGNSRIPPSLEHFCSNGETKSLQVQSKC